MILQCPNCSTQFNVPDGAIPSAGRKVKCASCAHKWLAKPEDAILADAPRPERRKRPRPAGAPDQSGQRAAREQRLGKRRRPDPTFETPDDLEKDAALAAQHHSIRQQMASSDPAQDTEIDPMAGIGDDDYKTPVAEQDQPQSDALSKPSDQGDDIDFMAKVSAGLTKGAEAKGGERTDKSAIPDDSARKRATRGMGRHLATESEKRDLVTPIGWGALAVFWLSLVGFVFMGGQTLQSLWPASSILYSALTGISDVERLKADAENLSDAITDEPEVINVGLFNDPDPSAPPSYTFETDEKGDNYLSLNVVVHNDGRRAARVPKLQITFVDRQSQPIGRWIVDPPGKILSRGSHLNFNVRRMDYPVGIYSVVVTIVDGSKSEGEAFETP